MVHRVGEKKVQFKHSYEINGFVQDRDISSALAMEIPQPCTKPS